MMINNKKKKMMNKIQQIKTLLHLNRNKKVRHNKINSKKSKKSKKSKVSQKSQNAKPINGLIFVKTLIVQTKLKIEFIQNFI
jgi:hypothetical protein